MKRSFMLSTVTIEFDKDSDEAFFTYPQGKKGLIVRIGCNTNKLGFLELVMHEFLELSLAILQCRYDVKDKPYTIADEVLFSFNHEHLRQAIYHTNLFLEENRKELLAQYKKHSKK